MKFSLGNFGKIIGTAVGGLPLASTVGAMAGDLLNYKSQQDALKQNEKWNQKNYDFSREQFQYQQYLNNNQTQIQAADAQKAGINPLAMNGGSLSAGNYSNTSNTLEAPQLGSSALDILTSFANMKNQRDMNTATNESNSENVQNQLDSQYKIEQMKLAQQNYEFEMDYILKNRNMTVQEREQARKEAYDRYLEERDSNELNETIRHNKVLEVLQGNLDERESKLLKAKLLDYDISNRQKARELFEYYLNGRKPGTGGTLGSILDFVENSFGKTFDKRDVRFDDFFDALKKIAYDD